MKHHYEFLQKRWKHKERSFGFVLFQFERLLRVLLYQLCSKPYLKMKRCGFFCASKHIALVLTCIGIRNWLARTRSLRIFNIEIEKIAFFCYFIIGRVVPFLKIKFSYTITSLCWLYILVNLSSLFSKNIKTIVLSMLITGFRPF